MAEIRPIVDDGTGQLVELAATDDVTGVPSLQEQIVILTRMIARLVLMLQQQGVEINDEELINLLNTIDLC